MDRLTPLADAFLEVEDVDPAVSLAIGSLAVFAGPAPSQAEFTDLIEARLPLIPRYRERLRPVLLDLAAPAWVDDEDFDIRNHVFRAAVPQPAGPREVAELVARLMTPRMDRSRPLWECWLCEGLPDGQWGVLARVHHSLADGVSGTDLYRLFLDVTPEVALPETPAPVPSEPAATAVGHTAQGLGDLVAYPARMVGAVARLTLTPVRSVAAAARTTRGLLNLSGAVRPVHPSSLLGPTGSDRRYAWVETQMSDVADVRHRLGATVNDVALAAIAGGLRQLLLSRGEEPNARTVRSLVPVSTRAPGTESSPDNQVSLLLPYLPVELADPVDRVQAVHRRLRRLRDRHEPEAGVGLTSTAELGPFPLVSWGLRTAWRLHQHQITTVTTNVPGPRIPLYCLGRPVISLRPWVPIADHLRIGVAMLSYRDILSFGITADHESVPDLHVLADGIADSWSELAAR